MIVDDGARWSLGDDAGSIAELSDYLKMPVGVAGNLCRGQFGNEADNPLLHTNAIGAADVVLALGCKFDFRHQSGAGIPPDATVIQVHTDMRQIGFNVRADVAIAGGSGPVTQHILSAVSSLRNPKDRQGRTRGYHQTTSGIQRYKNAGSSGQVRWRCRPVS
jgi:thiamine pyrophosphate-dependent acetolactate synthase large subunit-like protein